MKTLPGILAASLLFAAVCAASALAQDDAGGLVMMSGGGGSIFSSAGTLTLNNGTSTIANTYTGSSTLTISSVINNNNLINPLTGLQRFGSNTNNVPVLPSSLWPTLGSPTISGGLLTSGGSLTLSLGNSGNPFTVLPYTGGSLTTGSGGTLISTGTVYTGVTTISGGTLVLSSGGNVVGGVIQLNGNAGQLGGGLLISDGALTLTLANTFTVLPYTGGLTLGYPTLGATTTVYGAALNLNTLNLGTLTLGTSGTFTGATTISGGTLVLNGAAQVNNAVLPNLELNANDIVQATPGAQSSDQPDNGSDIIFQANTPEPSSAALLALGFAVPLWRARKRLVRA